MALPSQPLIAPLAPSKSKKEFFERLNLSEHNEEHEDLYNAMKLEAANGRDRINRNPESLASQDRDSGEIQMPYEARWITETAKHREILRIYNTASSRTRAWYDKGRYMTGGNEENWIVRWLLWHVFRYSDNRRRLSPEPSNDAPRSGLPYDPARPEGR
ncbi:MAG: hypothetical protein M1820_000338 [Bogoriella megaspora]|nr:MAG: hypothetical protein M1820_000338 [Bogoriella megaspora]